VTITRRKSTKRHCWSKWFPGNNRQTYDLTRDKSQPQ